ncbi:MAG: sensor domain-containing diguanylate cyclase [Beijerinckiaceae bacterium]
MNMHASVEDFFPETAGLNKETDLSVYRTLLESTQAIPWKIDWATMTFAYIGPQIEALLGWEQDSWKTVNDWVARMHPDDQDYVVNFCVSQSKAGIDHEADYRALTKDNGYVWIRDVVHVVRNAAGEVESLVGFMFDISERKKIEQKLIDLQKELEALSFEDGLTGIANRRKFDMALETEWQNACAAQKPLSLILCDLDHFKQFNDSYGHIQGDECLKKFARALNTVSTRAKDVTARYGGEEFVLLLPETDGTAARKIADLCRQFTAHLAIPHESSAVSNILTASIGVGTIIPSPGDDPGAFVRNVDELLYAAKRKGRNRVESAVFESCFAQSLRQQM